MSRRARQRQDSRPWKTPNPNPPAIPWEAISNDLAKRGEQQKGPQ